MTGYRAPVPDGAGLPVRRGYSAPVRQASAPLRRTQVVVPEAAGDETDKPLDWLLIVLMTVQAGVSVSLIFLNTAFLDEATYITAGREMIANWLHGAPAQPFANSFSGAPVFYPVLAAIMDSLGGLNAVRYLSLACMLVATSLVWSATTSAIGPKVAPFAAGIFASLASTMFLGALATYDALALVLLAAGAWCALRLGRMRGRRLAAAIALTIALTALADATKYAATLWDPAVVMLGVMSVGRTRGRRKGMVAGLVLAGGLAAVLLSLIALGGASYWKGITFTTLSRQADQIAPGVLLSDTAQWIGGVCLLALAGAALALARERRRDPWLASGLGLMALTALLAPAEQIRLHTLTSLFKHVGFGAWFAAIPAGYALWLLWSKLPRGPALRGGLVAVMAALTGLGAFQAVQHYQSWPNSRDLMYKLRPVLAAMPGRWLAEDSSVPLYYSRTPASAWSNTFSMTYGGKSGSAAFAKAVSDHHFRIVVLAFTDTIPTDIVIQKALQQTSGCREVAIVPQGPGGFGHSYHVWACYHSSAANNKNA